MNLEEFVQKTLVQIVKGADLAKKELGDAAVVTPAHSFPPGERIPNDQTLRIERVEFDVAITATEATESGGGGMLKVLSFGEVGGGGLQSISEASVSRVRFGFSIGLRATRAPGR
ncbi:MAG: hypothetical protein H6748_15075 [Spirochaetaceae bacterium]|nr:hypothetical protein [Spirochaetaceae bacterium]